MDGQTGQTDVYSRAYSAPESEHVSSGPYCPPISTSTTTTAYGDVPRDEEATTPRWPWIVGVAAIVAAIALVVSVSLLFARTDTNKLATPGTAPTSTPPIQDEIIVTTPKPAPPPPPTERGATAASAADQRGATAAAADHARRHRRRQHQPRRRLRPRRPRPQPHRRRLPPHLGRSRTR